MRINARHLATTAALLLLSSSAQAQLVISAKSGLIHYTEGEVFVSGKPIAPKKAEFLRLEDSQVLRTGSGRVELLLTPGVFLRLSENSEVEMQSSALSDTRLEVTSGSALLEVGEMDKEHSVTLSVGDAKVNFRKRGLFRIDASPAVLRAYDGEAVVMRDQQTLTLKEGKETALSGVLSAEKFDKEDTDAFYRWAGRRASYMAVANVTAAKSVVDSGTSWTRGGWFFNPGFGMYTYLPGTSNYYSPFGYSYYAPRYVVAAFYQPRAIWNSGYSSSAAFGMSRGGGVRSYSTMVTPRSSGGYAGRGFSAAAPAAAAPAAPAAAPRGAVASGPRGSGR